MQKIVLSDAITAHYFLAEQLISIEYQGVSIKDRFLNLDDDWVQSGPLPGKPFDAFDFHVSVSDPNINEFEIIAYPCTDSNGWNAWETDTFAPLARSRVIMHP